MNKFDKAVNKKANELITKNLMGEEVDIHQYNKFKTIARAMIREELREAKPSENPKSLYGKTWKTAGKYNDFHK